MSVTVDSTLSSFASPLLLNLNVVQLELSWVGVDPLSGDPSDHDLFWPGWGETESVANAETVASLSYSIWVGLVQQDVSATEETEEVFVRSQEVESVTTVTDEILLDAFSTLESEAVSQSEVFSNSLAPFMVVDNGVAREEMLSGSTTLSVSEAVADEAIDSFTQIVAESVGQVSELLDAFSLSDRTIISSAAATDDVFSTSGTDVEDAAQASSENFSSVSQTLVSEAEVTEEFELVSTQAEEGLVSTVTATDDLFPKTEAYAQLTSKAVASETPFFKNPGAVAWVMNTETAAPSWYSNWQFVDMVQVGDKVLAVGPEGLVEMGAGTDNGELIDAALGYGFLELGGHDRRGNPVPDPQKKRVDSFWFGYSSDDILELSVETLGQPVYTYSMEARSAEQARNNRIRPGKGLNARYWRVAITNVGGCEFDVDSVGADVVPTTRRL